MPFSLPLAWVFTRDRNGAQDETLLRPSSESRSVRQRNPRWNWSEAQSNAAWPAQCRYVRAVWLDNRQPAQFSPGAFLGRQVPILFLLTNAICLPALFVFSAFFGSRRSPLQTFVLLLAGTSVMGIALSGFAPVTLFFIVTTRHYQFFKIFNVFFFAVSGILGIVFFARTQSQFFDESPQQKGKAAFLRLWFLLYAFVGTQLAWTLRPFFGAPGLRFEIFRGLGGNFYLDIIQSIEHIFGSH